MLSFKEFSVPLRRLNRLGLLGITVAMALTFAACEQSKSPSATDGTAPASNAPTSPSNTHTEGEAKMPGDATGSASTGNKVVKTEAEWKQVLTEQQYYILREKGTERAFTGEYWDNKAKGLYVCAGCDQPLYSSETKFKSGTGWPSFWQAVDEGAIETKSDRKFFMVRTELLCGRCGGHLGHVFDDGPKPTGMRHCINSAALKFVPSDDSDKSTDK